ncbi:hypothetical protein OUZ56_028540 [Daphnia magna]|uniref:Uncharacterized protein n=1 Tax=Daphnia magna TaxID=35525 RepID=A0ABR0B462_9CRUS|nr:hypothetical protein OUZ56_028540 [Daphnia magna]
MGDYSPLRTDASLCDRSCPSSTWWPSCPITLVWASPLKTTTSQSLKIKQKQNEPLNVEGNFNLSANRLLR